MNSDGVPDRPTAVPVVVQTLDYAPLSAKHRWRRLRSLFQSPRACRWILIGAGVLTLFTTLWAWHRHIVLKNSLTALGGQERCYGDGRELRLHWAANALDRDKRPVVIVVEYQSAPRPAGLGHYRWSSSDSLVLKSSCRIATAWPPDPSSSGLWVDGAKRTLGASLTIVYVSDQLAATDIVVPRNEQDAMAKEVKSLDIEAFISKYLLPRLPASERAALTPLGIAMPTTSSSQ